MHPTHLSGMIKKLQQAIGYRLKKYEWKNKNSFSYNINNQIFLNFQLYIDLSLYFLFRVF